MVSVPFDLAPGVSPPPPSQQQHGRPGHLLTLNPSHRQRSTETWKPTAAASSLSAAALSCRHPRLVAATALPGRGGEGDAWLGDTSGDGAGLFCLGVATFGALPGDLAGDDNGDLTLKPNSKHSKLE